MKKRKDTTVKSNRKTKVLITALVSTLILTIGLTTAYLSDFSDEWENRFDPNWVKVDMEEESGTNYNIIPDTEETKNPRVKVNNSVDAFAYLIVTDNVNEGRGDNPLVTYSIEPDWIELSKDSLAGKTLTDGDGKEIPLGDNDRIYYREVSAKVEAEGDEDPEDYEIEYPVLAGDTVSYSADITNDDLDSLVDDGEQNILKFRAYAIQKTPFDDPLRALSDNEAITIAYATSDGSMGTVSQVSESVAKKTGEAAGAKATPKEGYKFKNWTDADENEVSTDEEFVPKKANGLYEEAAYTANFEPIHYTVEYSLLTNAMWKDKEPPKNVELFYGEEGTITQAECVYNVEGYGTARFTGWNTWVDGSGVHYDSGQTISNLTTEDGAVITLYPDWKYSELIFYESEDSKTGRVRPIVDIYYADEEGPSGSEAVAEPGYRFVNWTDDKGNVVCTTEKIVPQKDKNGKYSNSYEAHFELIK